MLKIHNRLLQTRLPSLKAIASMTSVLLLAGCATYQPRPLPIADDLLSQLPASVVTSPVELPPLRHHVLNPKSGFDATGVAMLAVVNNPDLKARRKRLGIAKAQVFAARLLPDPQLSLSLDHPTGNGAGLTNAQNVGLSYDLMDLITHHANETGARQKKVQQHLNLLWQEWLIAQKARQLYFQVMSDRQKLQLLEQATQSQQQRYERARHQLALGNVTLDNLSAALTGYTDMRTRVYQVRMDLMDAKHQLNGLLGLKPDMPLALQPLPDAIPDIPTNQTAGLAAQWVKRRPDLLALKAGYRSQEAAVRRAILHQFPNFGLGVNEGNDTSNVRTVGLNLQLKLPLWNANRGEIAVQRATRAALRQDYQARLDQSVGQVAKLHRRFSLMRAQYRQLQSTLPRLDQIFGSARQAYEHGNFSSLAYLNLQETLIKNEIEVIDLKRALWDTRIDYATLLGWPPDTRASDIAH